MFTWHEINVPAAYQNDQIILYQLSFLEIDVDILSRYYTMLLCDLFIILLWSLRFRCLAFSVI